MAAVSCVVLTNVVGRSWPFHCTREPVPNPVPVSVSVNAAPVKVESGLATSTVGTG